MSSDEINLSLTATCLYILITSLTLLLICSLDLVPVRLDVCLGRSSNQVQNPLVALGLMISIGVLSRCRCLMYADQLDNQYFLDLKVLGTIPL